MTVELHYQTYIAKATRNGLTVRGYGKTPAEARRRARQAWFDLTRSEWQDA
jgi:hypothetical protein